MDKIDSRIEKNSVGIIALRDLLRLIIQNPEKFIDNQSIKTALKSQAGTAALDYDFSDSNGSRRTVAMSLNTQKTHADEILERGFQGLNDLRLAALETIRANQNRVENSNKRTKSGLNKRVSELEDILEQHRKINFILLQALSVAMSEIKSIRDATDAKIRNKRAKEALEVLCVIASMNPPPYDQIMATTTVTNIDTFRK